MRNVRLKAYAFSMPNKNNFALNGRKFCSGCQETKSTDEFGKQSNRKDGLAYRCKSCMNKYHAQRYENPRIRKTIKANQEKYRAANPDVDVNKHLVRKYGITLEEYNRRFREQKGVCAICGKEESTRRRKISPENERLAVDHCHETGVVRGLLCFKCNTAIGSLGDTQDQIMKVINYLTNSLVDRDGDTFRIGKSTIQ